MKLLIGLLLLASCATKTITNSPEIPESTPPVVIEIKEDIFTPKTSLKNLIEATKISNCVIRNEHFKKALESTLTFDYSNENGKAVYKKMLSKKTTVTTYYKRYTSALAYTYLNGDEIYLNTKYTLREIASLVNTIIHEQTHAVGYTHGSNSPQGKGLSVPYRVGELAELNTKWCL